MTYATLHSYIMLCKLYGWQSSISGLYWYNRNIQLGLRDKWARRGIHAGKAGFVPPPSPPPPPPPPLLPPLPPPPPPPPPPKEDKPA